MPDSNTLVLEVWKQENSLGMSVFEQDQAASTLRYYHQHQVNLSEITRLCFEITAILATAGKKSDPEPHHLEQLKKCGQFLWDHLLARKVKERLISAESLGLVLLLDEELIGIPWELIYDGRDFLCLKFNIGRLLRTRQEPAPPRYRSAQPVLRMLILANPTADLPSAYQEGLQIRNRFDRLRHKMRIDFKSTSIDSLYVKKNLRDYDIVHYAGHCEYNSEDVDDSGWLLCDGRLSVRDINALGESATAPSIVFSNSCFSAKMDPGMNKADYQAGTYSLASAFLFSGVRHYIGTIRELEDKTGLVFAQLFYTFVTKGRSVGESLRLARARLVKEYGIAQLSWAGYLLYGDPAFILFNPPPGHKVKPVIPSGLGNRIKIKQLKYLAPVFISIPLFFGLWAYLPSVNPATYIAFSKTERLFEQGKNAEVIDLSNSIIKKDPMFLAVFPLAGDTYRRLGKDKEALKIYFDYMFYSQRRNDKKNLVSAYIKIGWFYHGMGDYQKAFDYYQKALTLSLAGRDKLGEAISLRKLAVWYIDKRQDDKALELLMKSSEINRERKNLLVHRHQLACDYFDIGLVFINKNDLDTAADFYRKSFELFKQLKLKSELSDYYFNLGEIHLFNKDYQRALDCYLQGLKVDQAQGNIPSLASDYTMLGELYMDMDNLKDAESALEETVSICSNVKLPQEEAAVYYDLGRLYARKRQKNKAREFYRLAQEIYYSIDPYYYQEIKSALRELDGATL
ncbi:MAG: tetratricopeptide repeat protein [Candidatus Omnitrophica bacterium]|nr:tetratricopeptide repeat protein [Candidatus Omnitrophota bacterium]